MPPPPSKSPSPQPSDSPRPEAKPRPGPEDLERIDAFLGDFLLPMLADGQIDTEEETPLVVAFHAYGIDAFDPWHVLGRAYDRIQFGVPGHSRSFAKAWARIQLHAERMTRNDFLRTRDWLEAEGRRSGLANLSLPDSDPGTVFSVLSIDRTCIARFQKLIETMRASNLPIAPGEVQPQTEMDEEPEAEAPGEGTAVAAVIDVAPVSEPAAASDSAEAAPSVEAEEPTPLVEEAFPAGPDLVDFPVPASVAESIPGLAERLRAKAPEILEAFSRLLDGTPETLSGFLFDDLRSDAAHQAVAVDALPGEGAPLWFLGDLHGDLLALEAALHCMESAPDAESGDRQPMLVLLGDLFDDGDHSYEVVLRILELVVERPGRIAILAGNHDEALAFDPEAGTFRSSVSPSDFTDWLNARAAEDATVRGVGQAVVRGVGQAVVRLFERAPRALFFPDGLLAAHGGIPLSDLWESVQSPADLNRPECLQDFVWTRAHPRARRKIPNRTTRGCEFGFEDFRGFCEAASRALGGRPVSRMVRGHDHVDERYQFYPKYEKHPLLTINAMSRRLPREVFGPYARIPVVALHRPGHLPQVHRLQISEESVRQVYPEPVETESPETRPQALDSALPDGR